MTKSPEFSVSPEYREQCRPEFERQYGDGLADEVIDRLIHEGWNARFNDPEFRATMRPLPKSDAA